MLVIGWRGARGSFTPDAPLTIQDMGFNDTGRLQGQGNSDGETSVYAEGFAARGALTLLRDSFDGQEDGVFCPASTTIDTVIDSSVFGRTAPNGLNDGRSHDIYCSSLTLTVRNSVFVGSSRGNTIKSRSATVNVSNSFIARFNGRWIDAPAASVWNSTGNTYVSLPGTTSQNAMGFYDEVDTSQDAIVPHHGTFTSTNDTFIFSRFNEVIWINAADAVVQFSGAKVFWIGARGSNPPTVTIQGPGSITGSNPFSPAAFTEANRLDAAPGIPADPTKP